MAFLGIHMVGTSESVILVQDKSITFQEKVVHEHSTQLTSVSALSQCKPIQLAVTDVEKNLLILEETEEGAWKKIGQWKVPKCPTSCAFYKDLCYVGDKFGQVFVYPPQPEFYSHVHLSENEENEDGDKVEEEKEETGKPLMGHVSMLTKLVVTEKFIITADRDEKIRVTDRQHPYIIHAFLLNHTSYVSDLYLCTLGTETEQSLLISSDGVGRICWWNLKDFSLLKTHELKVPIRQILSPSLFLEDDAGRIHRLPEGEFVFEEKVHCAAFPYVSTLTGLYRIGQKDTCELLQSNCELLQSCEQGIVEYEPKGRIAKRPLIDTL